MNTTNLKRIRPFLLVACLLALVYGAGPAARAQVTGQWTLVGLHPAASAITPGTHYARTLGTLRPWNGRLYIGYGDYDNNVGDPAKIIPYDPAEDRFVGPLLTSANREWTIYREIDGKLYSPVTDNPSAGTFNNFGVGQVSGGAESWSEHVEVPTEHVLDMATTGPGQVWMVGSASSGAYPDCPNCAIVWRSTDGGQSFTRSLSVAPEDTSCTNCASIFYFAGVLNGVLWVQARDFHGNVPQIQSHAWAFNGQSWKSEDVNLLPLSTVHHGYGPTQFGDFLVYLTRKPARIANNYLMLFDGINDATSANIPATVTNFAVDGDFIYVLMSNGDVRRTKDVTAQWDDWERLPTYTFDPSAYPLAPFGHGARSIAVLDGVVYLGTADAELYRLDVCGREDLCGQPPGIDGP